MKSHSLDFCSADIPLEIYEDGVTEIVKCDYQVRILYSVATFFVWMRAIYFFRLNRSTGYFIKMIFEVVGDLKNFFLIYIATLFAFAHAYLLLFRNNEDEETGRFAPIYDQFSTSLQHIYLIPMGDYPEEYQSVRENLGWMYFIIATLFLNVMMLNMLISIISDTYARIQSDFKVVMYIDLLNVINENQILYRGWQSDWLC
mmetsp:Transcript_18836/g.13656  ORF Transcript_18836/g.13656 Transcript_18836/m.13656 type:complete len:201 (-) Transcript_18836:370-972(-)